MEFRFFTTRVLSGKGSHCTLVTFRTLQQATTLGYSLAACTPCLYCQATQPCGFKIEIAMQSYKTQEKSNGEVPKQTIAEQGIKTIFS